MSNTPKDISEKTFQENYVKELAKYKWKAPDELNGSLHDVSVDDLISFWRNELNRINSDQLEGVDLTDNEFRQVMSKVNQINNSYEAAKILSAENSVGKIDGIYRDPNPKVSRNQITLTIFRKPEVRGGDSSYRVAREVKTKNGNRFDIVLLINGLPLINIEQKRTDKDLDEAYNQFKRYYKDGEYCNNFMAFSQMMVISTEIETRYFATPKTISDFNPAFIFHWTDEKNKPINDYKKIVEYFLMIPMAHQMVGDYLVIDEAEREEDRRHLLLRPYQVYALRAVEGAAIGYDNDDRIPHGGFVWHTTGSGKTITSFKTALFLATRAGFDKVVFLVDRRELDSNTSKNFKAYAAFEPVDVDNTPYTYNLKRKLESKEAGIVVTTTHKLSSLVKYYLEQQDHSITEKKIIFIIDEAHRTTMGEMMQNIREFFKNKSLFFGFTGTPLFDENNVKGRIKDSELINTTEKLFGPKLHEYTIDSAIADGNVLGFHIDYINTGEFSSYDQLRDDLIEAIKEEHPDQTDRDIERKVLQMTEAEVETESMKRDILSYKDDTHTPRVVGEILDNWDSQSQNRFFNAILTVRYKHRVIAYYHEFKKQMDEKNININIAMTFSIGNENGEDDKEKMVVVPDEILQEMLDDYKKFTDLELNIEDLKSGKSQYFEDLIDRTKKGGSGRSEKNIDLVIVADQLLTGYDSKRLNTLYVDRSLELQNLIQAYSRTNRIFSKQKEFGTIINFQYPAITEECVNEALKLYGSGGKSSKVIVDKYLIAVVKFHKLVDDMVETLPDPTTWQEIKDSPAEKRAFILAFRSAIEQYNYVQQYYEYRWNDETFGIDEHTWKKYEGAYKNLIKKDGGEDPIIDIIKPLVGKVKLAGTQVVDAAHILNLIGSKVSDLGGVQSVDDETLRIIYEQIQELSDMGDNIKSLLLKEFVDNELIHGKVSSSVTFDVAFDQWRKGKIHAEIKVIADEWGIDFDILCKSVDAFELSQPEVIPYIDEISKGLDYENATKKAGSKLMHMMSLSKTLPGQIKEVKKKYE